MTYPASMAAKRGASSKTSRKSAGAASGAADITPEAPIIVLHGAEPHLRALHTEKLEEALREAHGDIEILRYDGVQAQVADVLDECRSFGLMQIHKLVIVDNADQLLKATEDEQDAAAKPTRRPSRSGAGGPRQFMERYAASASPQATLLLRSDVWRPGKLDKLIAEHGGVIVRCEPLTTGKAIKWAFNRASKRHGVRLAQDAAETLVERVGVELGRLEAELAKLASVAASEAAEGAVPEITLAMVRDMTERTREEEVWLIQSQLLRGDAEACLGAVRQAISQWKQPPTLVMYACVDLSRKLHTAARAMAGGASPRQAAAMAKIWGPSQDTILDAAGRADPDTLADLLEAGVRSTREARTGWSDEIRAIERFSLGFATLRARSGR